MENDYYEYVTINDFDIRVSELQKQMNHLQTQIVSKSEIQAQIDDAVSDIGGTSPFGVIAFLLTLILAAFCVLLRNTLLARQIQIERLIKNPHSSDEDDTILKLQEEIRLLNARLQAIEHKSVQPAKVSPITPKKPIISDESDKPDDSDVPDDKPSDIPKKIKITKNPTKNPKSTDAATSDLSSRYANFLQDFNTLSLIKTGIEAKKSRDEFIKRYKVKAFSCANFNQLVNEPDSEPEFTDAASVLSGDYWAYEIDTDVYAVVPGVKTYTDNHHEARAMGKVFKSNFESGLTYSEIFVEKPAIFKGMWNLDTVGVLELSE